MNKVRELESRNKTLEWSLKEAREVIERLRNKLYSGSNVDKFEDWVKTAPEKLDFYIECLSAAYAKQTNINPDRVVLKVAIREEDGKEMYYWVDKLSMPELEQKRCEVFNNII